MVGKLSGILFVSCMVAGVQSAEAKLCYKNSDCPPGQYCSGDGAGPGLCFATLVAPKAGTYRLQVRDPKRVLEKRDIEKVLEKELERLRGE